MAHKEEDIMEKIRRTNPEAYHIMRVVDECCAKVGARGGVVVTTTDDMTEKEEEMALFEGFLKEGYPVEVAEKKAKEWLRMIKEFAEQNERNRRRRSTD